MPTYFRPLRLWPLVTSMLLLLFCSLPPLLADQVQGIMGRYRLTPKSITHTITIPETKPAAAIVVQYLPPHTTIVKTSPAYNSYDADTGVVKWLFTDVPPGILHITITLSAPVAKESIRAEVLFKEQSGHSNTFTIAPAPMKRRMLEGC